MIDIEFVRKNPGKVKEGITAKGYDAKLVERVSAADEKRRQLTSLVDKLREERNQAARAKNVEKGKEIKEGLETKEIELKKLEVDFDEAFRRIPNLPAEDVPVGKDESENKVIRAWGKVPKFDFKVQDHVEIGEALDIIDVKRAAKVAGTRFGYLKNEAVKLEFALTQFAFKTLTKEGFTPVVPPVLVKKDITQGLGYWEEGGGIDYYSVQEPDNGEGFYLVGTSEHSIVPMHKDEIFDEKDLPKRYVGFSTCFRREAGSYGQDTRGILRVHQFDKVEMVSFVKPEDDEKEHNYLVSLQERLFQSLELPYQVVKMCTADLGFPIARKYDLEAWIPSQDKYREVTSASSAGSFQARRLNIKFRSKNEANLVHILNATAFAMPRTLIAILENYQQNDGSVKIPKALYEYLGKGTLSR